MSNDDQGGPGRRYPDGRRRLHERLLNGGGRPYAFAPDTSYSRNGGGAPAAVYVPGNDASTSVNGVGALAMSEPLDDGVEGTLPTYTNVRFPCSAWAPVLRAQLLVAEFGGTNWREIEIPPPSYDPDDLRDQIMTLMELRQLRGDRIEEIVAQAQDFTNYFANVLMISPASHPRSWTLLCAAEAIGQLTGMYFKNKWPDRPRPVQIYPALMTAIPTPPHSSYPNAHCLQSRLIAECFCDIAPALRPMLDLLVDRITENRAIAGVHFVTDKIGSEVLARGVMERLRGLKCGYWELINDAKCEWGCLPVPVLYPPPTTAIGGDGAVAPPTATFIPVARKIDVPRYILATPLEWAARSQGDRTTCVAFAVTACIEHRDYADGMGTRLSEQFLHSMMTTIHAKSDAATSVIKLDDAWRALGEDGICTAGLWPYDMSLVGGDPGDAPSQEATSDAAGRRFEKGTYCDLFGNPAVLLQGNVAETVAKLLSGNHKPVAVCLPVFGDANKKTTWDSVTAYQYGIILDPTPGDAIVSSHCICIVGWVPDRREPGGGYFLFRNSWGSMFAERAPSEFDPAIPWPGYGTISASYINSFPYEILQVGERKQDTKD